MEETLQRVFSVLISVLILFILPLYITFEKMDDISYSLALKITSNFVDNVTAKGYLSEEMYNDFIRELSVTGNVYDIKMEHTAKKYNPVYYIYDNDGNIINVLDYAIYAKKINNSEGDTVQINNGNYSKNNIKLSYSTSEIKYSEKAILKSLDSENSELGGSDSYSKLKEVDYKGIEYNKIPPIAYMYANYKLNDSGTAMEVDNDNRIYTMNKGDEFSVRIKNENVTIATVLFNAFTLGVGGTENNTRVYINYGGTIQEEEYRNLDIITE